VTCCKMQQWIVSCWGMKKPWHGMLSNTAACHFLPWHQEWCHTMPWHTIVLPWHEEHCHGMKNNATACSTMLWHKEHGCSTKSIAVAQPKHSAAAQKTLPQHEMKCHGTKNMAKAPNQHQHCQIDCSFIEVTGVPPKPFWFAVKDFWMLQFTGDGDTFSMCACHCRKYCAKPLLVGFYFCNASFFKKSDCDSKEWNNFLIIFYGDHMFNSYRSVWNSFGDLQNNVKSICDVEMHTFFLDRKGIQKN